MTLEHPGVAPRIWKCVQTGLFAWSANLTLVDRAGEMGDCHHVKRRMGASWILVEAPGTRMDEWRAQQRWHPWRATDWPKLLLPECPVAA